MSGQWQLEHIKELKNKVIEQEYFIRELREALSGMTGISYDRDVVQTSVQGDPILDKLVKIEEEEERLQKMKNRWIEWKVQCIQKIHQMKVGDLQKLLYVVYIEEHGLKEASEIMGYSYDYFTKLHKKAVSEFGQVKLSVDVSGMSVE